MTIYEVTVEKCTVQNSSVFVGFFNTLENAQRVGLRARTSIDDEALIIAMVPNAEGKFEVDRMWELIEFEWIEQAIFKNGALQ